MKALLAAVLLSAVATPAFANLQLAQKYSCTACHAVDKKIVGPQDDGQEVRRPERRGSHADGQDQERRLRRVGSGADDPASEHPGRGSARAGKWVLSLK